MLARRKEGKGERGSKVQTRRDKGEREEIARNVREREGTKAERQRKENKEGTFRRTAGAGSRQDDRTEERGIKARATEKQPVAPH